MVLLFQDRTKEQALSLLRSSLKDTPIPHWRGDPICAALLGCYDQFDPVVDGFSDMLIRSVTSAVLCWAGQPELFPDGMCVEDRSMDAVEHWITQELLHPMKNWLYEVNFRTSRTLDAYFAQVLGRESVGFPLLQMGELQLYMAREITYDLTVMANERIKSYGLSRVFRPPYPARDGKRSRGYRLAHCGPKLATFLEEERLELRLRLNGYFLNEDFLSRYRDCVLEAAQRWSEGWEEDPNWGGLLPFTIRTHQEDEQLAGKGMELLEELNHPEDPD